MVWITQVRTISGSYQLRLGHKKQAAKQFCSIAVVELIIQVRFENL